MGSPLFYLPFRRRPRRLWLLLCFVAFGFTVGAPPPPPVDFVDLSELSFIVMLPPPPAAAASPASLAPVLADPTSPAEPGRSLPVFGSMPAY